jgi:hypothetical protein
MRDVGAVGRLEGPERPHREIVDAVAPVVAVAREEIPAAADPLQDDPFGLAAGAVRPDAAEPGGRAAAAAPGEGRMEVEAPGRILVGALHEAHEPASGDAHHGGVPGAHVGRQRQPGALQHVHAAQDIGGGAPVAHVDALEGEVAPAAHRDMEAAAALVDDDLARMVAEQEPVAAEEQLGHRLDPARIVEVEGPDAPMRRLEERQAGLRRREVELGPADVGRAVRVADDVRVAQARLPEMARLERRDVDRGARGAEAVPVGRQDGGIAQVDEGRDPVLHDRNPGARPLDQGGDVVLVDREGEPLDAGEIGRRGSGPRPPAVERDVDGDGAGGSVAAAVEGRGHVMAPVADEARQDGALGGAVGRDGDDGGHEWRRRALPAAHQERRVAGGPEAQGRSGVRETLRRAARAGGDRARRGALGKMLAHLDEGPRQEVEGAELGDDREIEIEGRQRRRGARGRREGQRGGRERAAQEPAGDPAPGLRGAGRRARERVGVAAVGHRVTRGPVGGRPVRRRERYPTTRAAPRGSGRRSAPSGAADP